MLTINEKFHIACQVNEAPYCDRLDMLRKCFKAVQEYENKITALKEYQKVLEKQLERWTRGKNGTLHKRNPTSG